jgi:hypothetical protein
MATREAKRTPKKARKRALKSQRSVSQTSPDIALLQTELRESIRRDINARIEAHQRDVTAIRAAARRGGSAPLMLLAHGDSWFDYPCHGNKWTPLSPTDIIVQLAGIAGQNLKILNLSHHGDATTDEMGLDKQKRLIDALKNPKNWLNSNPDAILFSGGGNDIAGDPFCIYLNRKDSGLPGLDAERFAGRLASVRSSYLDLFAVRDKYAAKVPILGHGYGNARPMQPHPPCTGPWIKPALGFTGWNDQEGRAMLLDALTQFRAMLDGLESDARHFEFTRLHTEDVLTDADWANELHPHPPGFKKLAQVFWSALQHRIANQI